MWIIQHKKIFYSISLLAVVLSVIFISVFGLKFSIDFTGGSVLEFEYTDTVPSIEEVHEHIDVLGYESYVLRGTGENGYILKLQSITDDEKNALVASLAEGGNPIEVTRFNTIGPTLGNELKTKAVLALVVVIAATIVFIAFAFRYVSKPVSSWKYGLVAIIALVHDIIITLGAFALLGATAGFEIDTLFVTALLVILGYSINDTIVVLDRVRENLSDKEDQVKNARFTEIVGQSLNETFARSLNTSLSTLVALVILLFIGAAATQSFALALVIGIVSGTYSSLFVAAPLLVSFKNRQNSLSKGNK